MYNVLRIIYYVLMFVFNVSRACMCSCNWRNCLVFEPLYQGIKSVV